MSISIKPSAAIFFAILVFLFTSIHTFGQSTGRKNPIAPKDPEIAAIRQTCQNINSLKLIPKRFTYESSGCVEEGVVTYYLNNKEIVKITESGSIGDGSWINEYYYNAGKAVFCFETIIGGPAIGKVTKTQYRYYIKDNHPIRMMEGAKVIPANSKATEILQAANKIIKAYTTKDFAGALCN